MGNATTWSDFVKYFERGKKKILAEFTLGEVLSDLSLSSGYSNTYEVSFLSESITFANGNVDSVRKEVEDIQEDGVSLTEYWDIDVVEANAGSWYHDVVNGKLYVHTTGSDEPTEYTLVAFFKFCVSTIAQYLEGRDWKPTGVVGWWKLNEESGSTAEDSSGYENDGTLLGTMTDDDWIDPGLDFDGSDDRVSCGTGLGSNLITDENDQVFNSESITNIHTSDFSGDLDGWIENGGTADFGIAGIGGEDDWLRLTLNSANSVHEVHRNTSFTVGKTYRLQAKIYIPSTNSHADSIVLWDGTQILPSTQFGLDTVVEIDHYFVAGGTVLYCYAMDGGSHPFQDPDGDDVIYLKDVIIDDVTLSANWLRSAGGGTGTLSYNLGPAGTEKCAMLVAEGDESYLVGYLPVADLSEVISEGENYFIVARIYVPTANTLKTVKVMANKSGDYEHATATISGNTWTYIILRFTQDDNSVTNIQVGFYGAPSAGDVLYFDNVAVYKVESPIALLGSDDFSVSFWFQDDGTGDWDRFFVKGVYGVNGTSPVINLERYSSDLTMVYVGKNAATAYTTFVDMTTLYDGNEHHVILSCKNSIIYLYVDKVKSAYACDVSSLGDFSNHLGFCIGAECAGSNGITGILRNFIVFNKAVTNADVIGLYNMGSGYTSKVKRFYEPRISSRGIPSVRQDLSNIFWGTSVISSGNIRLINNDGFFDQIYDKWIWTNKKVELKFGGDLLPYSEYESFFTGKIQNRSFSRSEVNFEVASMAFDLLRELPINNFWTSTYPNLDGNYEGAPIPYYYGTYTIDTAPIAVCIDTAYDTNIYQFKICDHAIKSITQVYIDYRDGAGWQTINHGNENLTTATFTLESSDYVVSTTLVKVAFEGAHSGGILIDTAPGIVEDILTTYCGYSADELDSASFIGSEEITEVTLAVPIEKVTSALTIIEKICRSDFAFFDENTEGKLRYRTWVPEQTGTIPEVYDLELLDPTIEDDQGDLYYQIKVGYSYQCVSENHLYTKQQDNASFYKYGKSETLTIDTYLTSKSMADILGQRILFVLSSVSPTLEFSMKAQHITKNLGDKLKITLERAPFRTSGGYVSKLFEIVGMAKTFSPLEITFSLRDLANYGGSVGFWMAADAPDYSSTPDSQKGDSGYWTDDDGYADPGNEESKNISKWW